MTQLNNQKPEAVIKAFHRDIDVHSMFYTIQGEGPHQGRPAIFLRLAGCNIQCPFCDTEYTEGRKQIPAERLAKLVTDMMHNHHTDLLVLTGGEPLRQKLGQLIKEILDIRYSAIIQIETNGTLPIQEAMLEYVQSRKVEVVVSPKTHHVHETMRLAVAWKYVLTSGDVDAADGLPIHVLANKVKGRVARPLGFAPVWVNPADSKNAARNKANMQAASRSALRFGYRLGYQMHKIFELE